MCGRCALGNQPAHGCSLLPLSALSWTGLQLPLEGALEPADPPASLAAAVAAEVAGAEAAGPSGSVAGGLSIAAAPAAAEKVQKGTGKRSLLGDKQG